MAKPVFPSLLRKSAWANLRGMPTGRDGYGISIHRQERLPWGAEDLNEKLLHSAGAAKLLDKMDLPNQLIPAILELS